ncbi:MAG: hypothetical protein ACKO96_41130, partial [Flammeovirgaceae bacterium]
CIGETLYFNGCTFNSPLQAYKFVPIEDGSNTFLMVDGFGNSFGVASYYNFNSFVYSQAESKLYKPDQTSIYQKWRLIRSPFNPDNFFLKLPFVNQC